MEDILSPHGALRAYTVFLTVEPRRGSLMMELLQYQGQIAHSPRCEWGWKAILSPHDALRAYTVFPTAEPRRGSSRVYSSSIIFSVVTHYVLTLSYLWLKVSDFL